MTSSAQMPIRIDTGENKSLATAWLLWLFLGPFGAHRFYLGRAGTGIVYFFTFGLFLLGWFFDAFRIGGWVRRANTIGFIRQG